MPVLINEELQRVMAESMRRYIAVEEAPVIGIREWFVTGGRYYVDTSTTKRLVVSAVDLSWSSGNGADFKRFSWAARESVLPRSCSSYDDRSIGWSVVSSYYCAFYLMLGLLRLFGFGLIYLNKKDVISIGAASGTITLSPGTYALRIELASRAKLTLEQKNGKGFHESFWRYADDCLAVIASDISTGAAQYRAFSTTSLSLALLNVEYLRAWLGQNSEVGREVGWMSGLRNDVNYKLTRNVWAPNFRDGGVTNSRLRADILGIIEGSRERLGANLRLDRDVRAMIERACLLFRDMSPLSMLPSVR